MVTVPLRYGVIVPVRNEALRLNQTVPHLLAATAGDDVHIVWVCNGCTDGSEDVIKRHHIGARAHVICLEKASKTAALQAGDDLLKDIYPRIYLDADTWLRPGDMARLMAPLVADKADLTSPQHDCDMTGATRISAAMMKCWLALPYARTHAFLGAVALSKAGRARWGQWPDLFGDDIFVTAMTPFHRRCIVTDALAMTWAPRDIHSWLRMRRRWRAGELQIRDYGIEITPVAGQRAALVRRLCWPSTAPGAVLFCLIGLLARFPTPSSRQDGWIPDRR